MSNILHNIKEKLTHHGDHTSTNQQSTGEATHNAHEQSTGDATHNVHTNPAHDNVKGKDRETEPTYGILPHPAKTNDPADLDQPQGLRHGGQMDAFHARDPYVPSDDIKNNLPAPAGRDELRARQAVLQPNAQLGTQVMPGHGNQQGGLL
ncbi:hypothetical protein GALMADRAFT_63328 [Galerina marginata CBS 339.88]|uniref:Uncharacterized protein n=1 Tax=Galerina marginata (strain CBS 339.88) TaxID=685588 RepID=A0A067TJG8_GALM3|nr:hypothetical protein GALMADRAFT_63328 [Galerina marginata CBS 339.88]